VPWPYSLSTAAGATTVTVNNPALAGVTVTVTNIPNSVLSCGYSQDSTCSQEWQASISTDGYCDISSDYSFSDSLLCRDVISGQPFGACISNPPATYVITIEPTDLCAPPADDVSSQTSYTLIPYTDPTHTTEAFTYTSGDVIYWVLSISDPLSTLNSITFNSIQMQLYNGQTGTVTGSPDVLLSNGAETPLGEEINLNPMNSVAVTNIGSTAILTFQVQLVRADLVNTVGQLSQSSTQLAVLTTVVADINYQGNSKRSVMMGLGNMDIQAGDFASRLVHVRSAFADEANEEFAQGGNVEGEDANGASHVAATFAALILCVFALMF